MRPRGVNNVMGYNIHSSSCLSNNQRRSPHTQHLSAHLRLTETIYL